MILNQENGGESVAGYSCNHNCEQGKRCPARQACELADDESEVSDVSTAFFAAICGLVAIAVIAAAAAAFIAEVARVVFEHWPVILRWLSI